jgi:hypothetical protein
MRDVATTARSPITLGRETAAGFTLLRDKV